MAIEEVLGYVGKHDLQVAKALVRLSTVTNLTTNLMSEDKCPPDLCMLG